MVSVFPIIRLQSKGHKHYIVFQIVMMLSGKRSCADYLKYLGFLNLNFKERIMFLDLKSLGISLNNGAFLKSSVKKYISKFIIL